MTKEGSKEQISCNKCGGWTSHVVQKQLSVREDDPYSGITIFDSYLILQCEGCKAVTFLHKNCNTEDREINDLTGQEELVEGTFRDRSNSCARNCRIFIVHGFCFA